MSTVLGIGSTKRKAEEAAASETSPVEIPVVAKNQIALTERAARKILQLAERDEKSGQFLRVGIQGGGCSGLSYTFQFTPAPETRDVVFAAYGAKVCVDPKSLLFLGGSVLEWQESLMKSGFVLKNPHEVKSCSCGESFTV